MTAVAFDPPKGDLDAMRKEIVSELKLWTAGVAARRILEQVCFLPIRLTQTPTRYSIL